MREEYRAEAGVKRCPKRVGLWSVLRSAGGISQQMWRCWRDISWGPSAAAEVQSSVKDMPGAMSVPVEGEVERSPDR